MLEPALRDVLAVSKDEPPGARKVCKRFGITGGGRWDELLEAYPLMFGRGRPACARSSVRCRLPNLSRWMLSP